MRSQVCVILIVLAVCLAGCKKYEFNNPVDESFQLLAPKNIDVVAVTETYVQLSWTDENTYTSGQRRIVKIEFELRTDSTEFSSAGKVSVDSSVVTISGIYNATDTYYFRAKLFAEKNISEYSPVASAKLTFTPPTDMQAVAFADSAVALQWQNQNPFITHFEIEQSVNGVPFFPYRTVSKETTSVVCLSSFINNSSYAFRVRGCSETNKTSYTLSSTFTIAFDPPTNFSVEHIANNAVMIHWKDNSDYEKEFVIERRDGNGSFTEIGAVTSNVDSYLDNVLDYRLQYEYRIYARSSHNITSAIKGSIRYDAKNLEFLQSLSGHIDPVYAVAVHPNSTMFASAGSDKTIKMWDLIGSIIRSLTGHTGQIYSLAFSPDGQFLISGSLDKTIKVWKVSDGTLVRTLSGHTSAVYAVSVSPDGQFIISASFDKTLMLWRTSDGEFVRTFIGHTQSVNSAAFSPDGSLIASGGADHTVKLWRVSDGMLVRNFEGHSKNIFGVVFSADGSNLLSAGYDNSVRWWRVNDGSSVFTLQSSDSNSVNSIALSGNNRVLICGTAQEKLELWNAEKHNFLNSLYGHTNAIYSVAVNPSTEWIITGGGDGLVKRWRINKEWVQQ